MVKSKLKRVVAYRCNICKKIVVGKSKMEKHMTIPRIFLPRGLVYFQKSVTGGYTEGWSGFDPYVTHNDYFVIVSSKFMIDPCFEGKDSDESDTSHCSRNLAYLFGSGDYHSISRRGRKYKYEAKGDIYSIDACGFRAFLNQKKTTPSIRLLKPKEFEKLIEELKNADTEMVKKELEFQNSPEGTQGIMRTDSWYIIHGKQVPIDPSTRIDRAVLEKEYHLTPEKLIRTTPSLERLIRS